MNFLALTPTKHPSKYDVKRGRLLTVSAILIFIYSAIYAPTQKAGRCHQNKHELCLTFVLNCQQHGTSSK